MPRGDQEFRLWGVDSRGYRAGSPGRSEPSVPVFLLGHPSLFPAPNDIWLLWGKTTLFNYSIHTRIQSTIVLVS